MVVQCIKNEVVIFWHKSHYIFLRHWYLSKLSVNYRQLRSRGWNYEWKLVNDQWVLVLIVLKQHFIAKSVQLLFIVINKWYWNQCWVPLQLLLLLYLLSMCLLYIFSFHETFNNLWNRKCFGYFGNIHVIMHDHKGWLFQTENLEQTFVDLWLYFTW